MDAVQAANSGHPGTPMALAPAAYVLFNEMLRYDPAQPQWPNRDRFVLSCGHASMLLYATLHLCGVKQADAAGRGHRQAGRVAGRHPPVPPVGKPLPRPSRAWPHQRRGNDDRPAGPRHRQQRRHGDRPALAGRPLQPPGFDLFDYNIYALCSDGDMMEGVGAEAASLAGHLKLSNLCWIYDDNKITIEGHTAWPSARTCGERFAGYGWNVVKVDDVNDLAAFRAALARLPQDEGPADADHRPQRDRLGRAEQAQHPRRPRQPAGRGGNPPHQAGLRLAGRPEVPRAGRGAGPLPRNIGARGQTLRQAWEARYADYAGQFPEQARELELIRRRELPEDWDAEIKPFAADAKGMATRASSGKVLEPDRQAAAVAGGRVGRPGPLDAHAHGRRRRFRGRQLRRPKHALRHPRARHGRDRQRHGPHRAAVVRGHVLRLYRLHAALDPPGGHHGPARVLRLHARLDRRGRGRPHAPADRAPGRTAGDSQSHGHSARRRQRSGRGLSLRDC